jgi:hypothetical protein
MGIGPACLQLSHLTRIYCFGFSSMQQMQGLTLRDARFHNANSTIHDGLLTARQCNLCLQLRGVHVCHLGQVTEVPASKLIAYRRLSCDTPPQKIQMSGIYCENLQLSYF